MTLKVRGVTDFPGFMNKLAGVRFRYKSLFFYRGAQTSLLSVDLGVCVKLREVLYIEEKKKIMQAPSCQHCTITAANFHVSTIQRDY